MESIDSFHKLGEVVNHLLLSEELCQAEKAHTENMVAAETQLYEFKRLVQKFYVKVMKDFSVQTLTQQNEQLTRKVAELQAKVLEKEKTLSELEAQCR